MMNSTEKNTNIKKLRNVTILLITLTEEYEENFSLHLPEVSLKYLQDTIDLLEELKKSIPSSKIPTLQLNSPDLNLR